MLVEASPLDVAKRARRRIARRVMPFLFVLYVINFLDRMNIGAAALQMPKDLGFIGFGSHTDGIKIVVQMLVDEKRKELDLEKLWGDIQNKMLLGHYLASPGDST